MLRHIRERALKLEAANVRAAPPPSDIERRWSPAEQRVLANDAVAHDLFESAGRIWQDACAACNDAGADQQSVLQAMSDEALRSLRVAMSALEERVADVLNGVRGRRRA